MTPEPSNEYQKLVEAAAKLVERFDGFMACNDGHMGNHEQAYQRLVKNAFVDWDSARAALSALSVSETAGRVQLKLPHAGDDGWQDIATAPHACHVLAARFDDCEWVYGVVLSPPSKPFTHWRPLPTPPAKGTPHV